jgi:hypothetical protein
MSHDRENIKAGRNRRNTSRWVVSVVKAASTIVWLLLPTAASQQKRYHLIGALQRVTAGRTGLPPIPPIRATPARQRHRSTEQPSGE